jgi:D-alanyl-D-alanine carboxypeptidase
LSHTKKALASVVTALVALQSAIASIPGVQASQPPIAAPAITAQRAIVFDPATGAALYEQQADSKALQGSVAKIMTAHVALWAVNHGYVSLDDQVAISQRAQMQACSCLRDADQDGVSDVQVGELFSLRDLIYAIFMRSAGEATDAVAEYVGGAVVLGTKQPSQTITDSETRMNVFLGLMNQHVQQLGLQNTVFMTVHGGDSCDFSIGCNPNCDSASCAITCPQGSVCNGGTTPRDLAGIWWHAESEHKLFLTAAGARTYTIQSNLTTYPLTKGFGYYPGVDGDKNGLSGLSKNSQIAQATRAGRTLIAVVQQSQVDYDANGNVIKLYAFGDIADLFRYGFARLFSPDRRGDSDNQAGAITDHAVDCSWSGNAVSAIRTNADTLRVIYWDVDTQAAVVDSVVSFVQQSPAKGGRGFVKGHVKDVDVAFLLPAFFVTATVEGGAIKLRSWNVTKTIFNEPKINPLQVTGVGGGDGVRLLTLNDNHLLLLVVRGPDGLLRLTTWSIAFDGAFTQLGDSGPAGEEVTEFSASSVPLGGRAGGYRVTTGSETLSGFLRLDNWTVASNGSVSFVHGLNVLPDAAHPSVLLLSPTEAVTATAVAPDWHLMLDSWFMFADGFFTGGSDSSNPVEFPEVTETNLLPMGSGPGSSFLVAARVAVPGRGGLSHHVRLYSWEFPVARFEAPTGYDLLGASGNLEGDGTELDSCLLNQFDSAGDYVTAFRNPSGSLSLSAWQVAPLT